VSDLAQPPQIPSSTNPGALPPPLPPAKPALQEAPGYKGAKICGILSICFALTCIGCPVAIVLGIVALVKNGTAKRMAREAPATYRTPPAGALAMGIVGLVLGIFALPTLGIGASVTIPILLAKRDQARAAVLQQNISTVKARAEELVLEARSKNPEQLQEPDQVIQSLLNDPALAQMKNPFDPKAPAMESAENPSQDGTIALWPTRNQNEGGGVDALVTITATYPEHQETQKFEESVSVYSLEMPPMPQQDDETPSTDTSQAPPNP
jgi:hypothetical protein